MTADSMTVVDNQTAALHVSIAKVFAQESERLAVGRVSANTFDNSTTAAMETLGEITAHLMEVARKEGTDAAVLSAGNIVDIAQTGTQKPLSGYHELASTLRRYIWAEDADAQRQRSIAVRLHVSTTMMLIASAMSDAARSS